MRNLTSYFILIALITFSSCNQNDNEIDDNSISGFYKIESINSKILVDLNGDLQKSFDLKNEINDYFNNYDYDLEIRPNFTNETDFKLISFYFPEPSLSFDYPGHPNGFVEYAKNSVGFQYQFNNNKFLIIEPENDFIIIDKIELVDNGKIKSTILKDYYDFDRQNWIKLEIEIIYNKMD